MREHLAALEPIAAQSFEELLPGSPPAAIQLLHELLQFRPSNRLSVTAAMDHSFFSTMQTRCERSLSVQPVDAATIDFEHAENKIPHVRKKILQEIKHYAMHRSVSASGGAMEEAAREHEQQWWRQQRGARGLQLLRQQQQQQQQQYQPSGGDTGLAKG